MSHTREHELGREVPRFEPWLGWLLLTFVPIAGLFVAPSAYDPPLIVAAVAMLAIAFAALLRQTEKEKRRGGWGERQ